MDGVLLVFIIMASIAAVLLGGMVGLQLYFEYNTNKAYEMAANSPEVIAFSAKYNNIEKSHMDLNTVFYDAYGDDNNNIHLQFYAGNVHTTPRVTIDCYAVVDGEEFSYSIDKNVLEYIQNYNCLTDKYP